MNRLKLISKFATTLAATVATVAVTVAATVAVTVAVSMTLAVPAHAQSEVAAPPPNDPFSASQIIDFPEQMREFVRDISAYARTLKPNFVIIAKDGLGLVEKISKSDETKSFPARAYVRSLDGVLETELLNDKALAADLRDKYLKTAQNLGLNILNMEFATDPKTVAKLYSGSAQKHVVPFVGESSELSNIPASPKAIHQGNSKSIGGVRDLKNYLYIANSQGFGTVDDYVRDLRDTNYDAVVINVFHGRNPLKRRDIEQLRYKKLGTRRLVLAELDISSAATFHYYWQKEWGQGSPPYIYFPFAEDPDRYRVTYWDPAWQALIYGDPDSYLYGILDLGFDGVVLKGVDAWMYYNAGGESQ